MNTKSVLLVAVLWLCVPVRADAASIDWVGMNLGGGAQVFNPGAENAYGLTFTRAYAQGDLLLFNFRFARWYLTAVELHPVIWIGYVGGGSRAGLRLPLGGSHELRVGLFAGMDVVLFHINAWHPTLSLRPHLQYVYSTRIGSVGVGIDGLLNFHMRSSMRGHDGNTADVPAGLYGVGFYLRWTVGRTQL
ncbi:MAG: hypothetical protein KC503_13835 [Myxococcales bacterium]|nr:hypothetical protein [Myxococcales bacterium]